MINSKKNVRAKRAREILSFKGWWGAPFVGFSNVNLLKGRLKNTFWRPLFFGAPSQKGSAGGGAWPPCHHATACMHTLWKSWLLCYVKWRPRIKTNKFKNLNKVIWKWETRLKNFSINSPVFNLENSEKQPPESLSDQLGTPMDSNPIKLLNFSPQLKTWYRPPFRNLAIHFIT